MTPVSLATMWAQQARFADLARFRDTAAFGYGGIEASHSTDTAGFDLLLRGVIQ